MMSDNQDANNQAFEELENTIIELKLANSKLEEVNSKLKLENAELKRHVDNTKELREQLRINRGLLIEIESYKRDSKIQEQKIAELMDYKEVNSQ